jgi:hypothetical protein
MQDVIQGSVYTDYIVAENVSLSTGKVNIRVIAEV